MKQVSVSQQIYVNQGQFIINEPSNKLPYERSYIMHFILPLLVGALLGGVPLASLLTLYLTEPCKLGCASETTTTAAAAATATTATTTVTTQTSPVQAPYYCSGVSPYTLWQAYSISAMTMNINTSSCNFSSVPIYIVSMSGITYHWVEASYTAIYSPTKTSFTIYATSLWANWNSTVQLSYANTYTWGVNWLGISN